MHLKCFHQNMNNQLFQLKILYRIMSNAFCVPEKLRPYYFAEKATYRDSVQPITVQDFTLWAQLSSLDTITSPVTVFATKSPGSSAFMYRIDFDSKPPDEFEVSEEPGLNIFYISSEHFIQLEASHRCVPVPQNNWEECSLRFHALGAFYRLNVIPSLSLSLFEREDLFGYVCKIFFDKYRVSPPLCKALFELFTNLIFALEFFGFAIPSNIEEERSIKAVKDYIDKVLLDQINDSTPTKNRINNSDRSIYENVGCFAFSEIKFAIANYHNSCFPNRQKETGLSPYILDCTSYSNLLQTLNFVRRSLISMNMMPDKLSSKDALIRAVNNFQQKNGLPVGSCDLFTIRHIWNQSMTNECDLFALCRLSGMKIVEPKAPIYTKTLGKIEIPNSIKEDFGNVIRNRRREKAESNVDAEKVKMASVALVMNQIFEQVKDRSEAPQWMIDEARVSIEMQINRINKAASNAKEIDKSISEIEKRLDETCRQNKESTEIFVQTANLLDGILNEHASMKKEFAEIKKRIDQERRGNKLLLAIIAILAIFVFYHFFKSH